MELIRRNSDYALRSLTYMAKFPKGKIFTISLIAKKEKVPAIFLRKIFQKLTLSRIVGSRTGPAGGFYLLKNSSQITLKEVLEAVQGCVSLSDCMVDGSSCRRSKNCRLKKGLTGIQRKLIDLLENSYLIDFLVGN